MRISLTLAALLLAGAATSAFAGYDKTTWGMSVGEVQALYPGGVLDRHADGRTEYRVLRPVAGLSTAMITFDFGGPKGGLKKVSIVFPEQGTDVDLRQALFEPPSPVQAESVRQTLRAALIAKYGPPAATQEKNDGWLMSNGDVIQLGLVSVGAGITPGIEYTSRAPGANTSGL
ncbi:MAG TPA: hypothetical protein VMK42_06970 [Anaeromyxobacteraceae bacterium]|nr:hypothetical protein [Anaeromyxobacteraceae bacterium]